MKPTSARSNAAAAWAILTAVFAASALLPPPGSDGQIAHLPSVCPFYNLTGLPCPGCGLTRAFVCLAHGQWRESMHWHPLGWALLIILILLWLRNGIFWLHAFTIFSLPSGLQSRLSWIGITGLLVFGAVRIGWLTVHHVRY